MACLRSLRFLPLLALAGCSLDLWVPPPPAPAGPGTLYGRAVYFKPGDPAAYAAAGASVGLIGGGLATTAGADGHFLLDGLTNQAGKVLIRFSLDGSGLATHQTIVDLAAVGAGPGRQIGLGDVPVSLNATLHGRVLRADLPGPSGHGGTIVYVPQGPFTAYTGDDGSFQLRDLPPGTLSIAFFRVGFQTITMDGVTLRAGQDTALTDQVIQVDTSAAPTATGTIGGAIAFSPVTDAAGTSVVAVDGAGNSFTGSITSAGAFTVTNLPSALYQVTVSHAGYAPTIASNLALAPGESIILPGLTLTGVVPGGQCVGGTACVLAGTPCHVGAVKCLANGATCEDSGATVVDGTPCGGGATCQGGTCVPFCAGGGACVPAAAPCHVGVVTCDLAGPTCTDTGALRVNGSSCSGAGMVCSAGACISCAPGLCACSTTCAPANPCHLGSQTCAAGSTCTDLGSAAPDGTACGSNQVCLSGACTACLAGVACQPSNPCKTGVTSCGDGVQTCVETASLADFTSCGAPRICRAGACALPAATVTSLARSPAGATSPLYAPRGLAVSKAGDVYVADTTSQQVKRIDHATGAVTVLAGTGGCTTAGDGGPAVAASLCNPEGLALDEAAGILYVAETSGGVVRAIQLTGQQLINHFAGGGSSGLLAAGDGGLAAVAYLASPSQLTLNRAAGGPQYLYVADLGNARIRRIDTSTGLITTWLSTSNCGGRIALYDCGGETGCGVAFDAAGNGFVGGTICGTDPGSVVYGVLRVGVDGTLAHVAGRYQGSSAEGINARLASLTTAPTLAFDATGSLFLADRDANRIRRIDGASGRIDTFLGSGAATSLGDGGPASAATTNGPWALTFDPLRRLDLTFTEVRGYAVRLVQNAGSSTPPQAVLSVVSGNGQSVPVAHAAPSPIVAKLSDGGGAPLTGYAVRFSVRTAGGSLWTLASTSDASGLVASTPQVGAAAGPYQYAASFTDIHGAPVSGSPVLFDLTATPPGPGTVTTLVDAGGNQTGGPGGPAALASMSRPAGVALATDGTLYYSDYNSHQVRMVSPAGILSVLAGTGACSTTGDGGLALLAGLCYPRALALDEAAQRLYVADGGNNLIRVIALGAAPTLSTVAGGGTAGAPGYGDGGPATSASLSTPHAVALGTDTSTTPARQVLYVADPGHSRIRRVDLSAGTISSWLVGDTSCARPTTFYGCGTEPGCSVAFDGAGRPFVSAQLCGSDLGGNTYGVARVDAGGNLTRVAGRYSGVLTEGIWAGLAGFSYPPVIAFDGVGNLWTSDYGANRIRRVDGASGRIDTAMGNGTASSTGDGGAAAAATVNQPLAITFDPVRGRDLVVADYGGNAIRWIPSAAPALPSTASITLASGAGQAPPVGQPASQPLVVKLADGQGAALAGYPVQFGSLTGGGSLATAVVATDVAGLAADGARVGRAAQTYAFQASYLDLHGLPISGSPVSFQVGAAAPATGAIFTLVNAGGVAGSPVTGTPSVTAAINRPGGVTVASDGTVYLSLYYNHQLAAVAPDGTIRLVAGTGGCTFAGDGGPALAASLCYPRSLALDEANQVLFVADSGNNRIRAVSLKSGTITTVAGGGSAVAPDYGDGGPATAATFSGPYQLTYLLDATTSPATRRLYVGDSGHGRIRRVDLGAGVITAWLTGDTSCTRPATFYGCGNDPGCAMIFDPAGRAFVSGLFCGSDFGGSPVNGVARVDPGGAVTAVAGVYNGLAAEGVSARMATFGYPPTLALDAAGNLYTADFGTNKVRRIESATGRITTVVGTGAATTTGDYGPASAATVNQPYALAFDRATGLDLVIAEWGGNTFRMVAGLGAATAPRASLSLAGGSPQAPFVDGLAATPLSATLLDEAARPLLGYPIRFSTSAPGAALTSAAASTDATGTAAVGLRVGRAPGTETVAADFRDLHGAPVSGSPVTFTLQATGPAPGTIFTAVGVNRAAGNAGVGGPATLAQTYAPGGLAVATDGTIYFSEYYNHQVKAVSPSGVLSLVAGTGGCSFGGDGGQASLATLCYPKGLALDEAGGLLYVADSNNQRVRVVNLVSGLIQTVVGGGTAPAVPWGDGGPATSATLSNPVHVRLHGSTLYVSDVGHSLVRVVGLSAPTPVVSTLTTTSTTCTGGVVLYACGEEAGCDVATGPSGTLYVSGSFCGGTVASGGFGTSITYGVASWDGASFTRVLGLSSGAPVPPGGSVAVGSVYLAHAPALSFDPSGRLVLNVTGDHFIGVADLAAGTVAPFAGVHGTAGFGAGDYVAATGALLYSPWATEFGGGHAVITDQSNHVVRIVW